MNFQSLIENSNEIIYEITLQGAIVSVSKKLAASLGHEAHEMIGKKFRPLFIKTKSKSGLIFKQN
jgi:PAS domain S-box-containing protein